jgi:hypothetical protein
LKKFVDALWSLNAKEIHTAARKEASRQVGEMVKWRDLHLKFDPDDVLWVYQDLFPLVKKAERYRSRIYNRTREIEELQYQIKVAQANQDQGKIELFNSKWADLEMEQYGYCWKIMKIYCVVREKVILTVGEGEDQVFKEFEYDPEKFG